MILETLKQFFTPQVMLYLLIGVAVGIIGGAVPGISPSMTIALLLPTSLYLPTIVSIALLLGAYQGAMFGGSISAILINTPGTAAGAATAMDGYQLAQKGKAEKALQMALYASCTGGLVGCVILLLGAQSLAQVTLKFGSPEYFALMVMSLVLIAGISGKSLAKGLLAAGIGLAAATVGTEIIYGARRFTFGNINLADGFNNLSMFIGLFAFSEVLVMLSKSGKEMNQKEKVMEIGKDRLKFKEYLAEMHNMIVSGIIGALIGILPGIGGSTASFLSYAEAQRRSKKPEEFGHGSLSGIAAPEAANNAVCGGALVPVLTLGIPGDVVTAILIGALVAQGIHPGPLMFVENLTQVHMIYIGLALSIIVLSILGTLGIPFFSKLVKVRKSILIPMIIVICVIGTYASRSNFFDCIAMVGFGFVGYLLKRGSFPLSPMVIAFVIGRSMESSLRQSLILSSGSPMIFFQRPICAVVLAISVIAAVLMVRRNFAQDKKQVSQPTK